MTSVIYLEWVDSAAVEGWQRTADHQGGVILVRSIGWLMEETDQYLTLAGHLGREDDREANDPSQALGYLTIPKGAITMRADVPLQVNV